MGLLLTLPARQIPAKGCHDNPDLADVSSEQRMDLVIENGFAV
jgi:hypothetical protein